MYSMRMVLGAMSPILIDVSVAVSALVYAHAVCGALAIILSQSRCIAPIIKTKFSTNICPIHRNPPSKFGGGFHFCIKKTPR